MKFSSRLFVFAVCLFVQATAQQKAISLEELWGGGYSTADLDELHSMKNGEQYTVLEARPVTGVSAIVAYDYVSSEKTGTIVQAGPGNNIPYFTSYEFSNDENRILLATDVKKRYRHSKEGIYYVYDRNSKELLKVADLAIREPAFSPDGRYVAYVLENNMYLLDLDSRSTSQLTSDGKENSIINGVTDWVYEEEFSFVRAYQWNSASTKIAFLRFDESAVPEFTMDIFGQGLYPDQKRFKYPKAGEANSDVTLHLYDISSGNSEMVPLEGAYYIPRIQWMNNPNHLSVQALNRHQDSLKLYRVDAGRKEASLLLLEKDPAYVEIADELTFLQDDRFIWLSERDGYNHLYLYGSDGALIRQLTRGSWDVTKYYGYDPANDRLYYQSTENGSINRDLYSVDAKAGKKRRLSSEEGTHSATFSGSFAYYIDSFSNATTPPAYTLHEAGDGKLIRTLKDNNALLKKLSEYSLSPKEFSTLPVNGNELNMWMVRPPDFDPSKKYPLLLYQYSGPGSQEVANSWMTTNDYWHQILADSGYIVACVDGRGTGFKGREFKKVTYKELGKYEVADQIAVAKALSERPYIDPARTGIWGWSYGGFMATNCLLKGADTFEMAIAVAPVTSWRFYDSIYTERYMQTPAENAKGYDENSPLSYPELLKGSYLLVHGSGDDNVHVQNSMRMIEALIQSKKQFDWAIYPDKDHSISGGNTRLQLFTKMTRFIKEHL
jgi:dipeptidyl-peptidase-4